MSSSKRPDGSPVYSQQDARGTPMYVERRAGIEQLIASIQREHPSWSPQRCAIEAKHRWTSRGGYTRPQGAPHDAGHS
jgi:hypothetical protein